jgi:hypothetical protein
MTVIRKVVFELKHGPPSNPKRLGLRWRAFFCGDDAMTTEGIFYKSITKTNTYIKIHYECRVVCGHRIMVSLHLSESVPL